MKCCGKVLLFESVGHIASQTKVLFLFPTNNVYMNLLLQIIRLLANHPHFGITLMTADRKAGQSIGEVYPHLITQVRHLRLQESSLTVKACI